MTTQTEQAAFETWARDEGYDLSKWGGNRKYKDDHTLSAWHGWAAARALVSQPALSRDQVPHNPHPKAPHGFDRGNAHSLGRYVCYCENWAPAQEAAQHVSAQGPAELWLQLHGESMELDEPVDYTDGVTWCWEQIYEGDVRYVRAAEGDTELLDWLDSNGCTDVHKLGNRWYVRQGYGSPVHRSDTLRDAIRAAIAAQGEPK